VQIAFLLFDEIAALDAVGPYEVLARLPGVETAFVALKPGSIRAKGGLVLQAECSLAEVTKPDVLVVPGGAGVRALLGEEVLLSWLRKVHAGSKWTTSVCTGALLLGAAGILRGLRATTHWRSHDLLSSYGATPVHERVVEDGKVMTAAGVSAGIDLALVLASRLAGKRVAQAIQLSIEYDPEPPFDCGNPEKAGPEIVSMLDP
jgi:transcriptional regulator GlxA family with amidase domain